MRYSSAVTLKSLVVLTKCVTRDFFFNTIVHSPMWYQLIQYKSVNTSAQDENTTSYYIRKEKKRHMYFNSYCYTQFCV